MHKIRTTNQFQSSLLGIIALILWSTSVAVTRTLSEQVGPFTSASYAYMIGGFIGVVYIVINRRRLQRLIALPLKYVLSSGGILISYNIVLYLAVGLSNNRSQVLGVSLINHLWAALILIFTVILLKRKANLLALGIGIAVSISGSFLATVHHVEVSWASFLVELGSNTLPYILALSAAISWGLYTVLNKYWEERAKITDGHFLVAPAFFLTGVLLLIPSQFFNETSVWSTRSVVELLFLALFPLLIAYAIWSVATQGGKIVFLGVASMFLPLFSTLVSCMYLQIVPGWALLISCVLTIAGAAICLKSVQDDEVRG